MKRRILVVAEDASLRAMLARALMQAGQAVELAEGARRAREVIAQDDVALAIVAPHGMGEAGAALAREIRQQVHRLILITEPDEAASSDLPEAVRLSRPFSEQELFALVKAELSARVPSVRPPSVTLPDAPQVLRFEGYTLDAQARTCLDSQGKEVSLTRAEFSLLLAFARQPGRVLSRDELSHVVAGRGAEPDDRSVDVLISRLRRKIEPDPKLPRIIMTLPGEGYKFTARPESIEPSTAVVVATPQSVTREPMAVEVIGPGVLPTGDRTRLLWLGAVVLAVLALATIGWTTWKFRAVTQQVAVVAQAVSSQPAAAPAPPPQPSQDRALIFKRMMASLQDNRYSWRTIERLAIEAGVDEAKAHEILAEHSDEIVLGKSHEGKLIARLSAR
jgi:two-component system OmpR family response regulator